MSVKQMLRTLDAEEFTFQMAYDLVEADELQRPGPRPPPTRSPSSPTPTTCGRSSKKCGAEMALTTTVTIHGLAELDTLLRQLPEEVAGDIMREGLEAGAEVIRTATAANIHSRTERLAKSLRVGRAGPPRENSRRGRRGRGPQTKL